MKNVLIGGIGNVLLGDDAAGPTVIRLLEANCTFAEGVEVLDLGTPALDLTHRIAGRDAVILVDCLKSNELAAGSVVLYRKADVLSVAPAPRLDPHSPTMCECLLMAEMLGVAPENLLLVGVAGESFEPGRGLSAAVERAVAQAADAVVAELERLGMRCERRAVPVAPEMWWERVGSQRPAVSLQ